MTFLGIICCALKTLLLIMSISKIVLFFNRTSKEKCYRNFKDYWDTATTEDKENLIIGIFGTVYIFISSLLIVIYG